MARKAHDDSQWLIFGNPALMKVLKSSSLLIRGIKKLFKQYVFKKQNSQKLPLEIFEKILSNIRQCN